MKQKFGFTGKGRRASVPSTDGWLIWDWLAVASLLIIAATFVTMHVAYYTKVSPVDELQHIDYLYKAPNFVLSGESVGNEAMREEACRGIDAGFVPPPCDPDGVYNPRDFQENGYNTAAVNTPIYYTLTRAVATPVVEVLNLESLVTGGRLAGAAWLGVGLVITYAVGRRLGAARGVLIASLIVLAATPSIIFPAATISPDAMVIPLGALSVWTLLWWEDAPRRRWWALAAVTALTVLVKMTNLVVIGGIGLYILLRLIRGWQHPDDRSTKSDASAHSRQLISGAVAIVLATLVSLGGWLAFQSLLPNSAPADVPMVIRFTVDEFPAFGLVDSLASLINPLQTPNVWVGEGEIVNALQRAASLLFVSGIVAGGLFMPSENRSTLMARAWILVAVLAGLGFIVLSYFLEGVYVPIPARYSATLVPFMVALTATYLRTKFAQAAVWTLACGAILGTVLRLTEIWV